MILRNLRFFTQPRFWAEEGMLHFAYSYSHPWFQALFQPQLGYLNFWPNLATLLARLVPLEQAPLVTTLMALLVQLIPAMLILWSRSPLWNSWTRKILAICVMLFVPLSNEVWLNSVNSYAYFATITFLLLLEPPAAGAARRWIKRLLLLLGGLSGTLSCFLIPLFVYKAWMERNRERWIQTGVLAACAIVQVVLIFTYRSSASFGERFHLIGFTTFGATMGTQTFGLFAFGFDQARAWGVTLYQMAVNDLGGFQAWGRGLLVVCAVLLILLSKNLSWENRVVFLGGYGILMLFPMMFSVITDKYDMISTGLHQRLFLAPNILCGWMLLTGTQWFEGKDWRSWTGNLVSLGCTVLLALSVAWGFQTYRQPWYLNETWPDWTTEVQKWKADPSYPLQIMPDGWAVDLSQ